MSIPDLLTNRIPTANIFRKYIIIRNAVTTQERVCSNEPSKKNLLQDLSDRLKDHPAVTALPETEGRRQRKDPAGSHSEKEMQQSPDHHGCREQETGTDPPPGKVSGGRRHSIFHLFYPVPVLMGAPELERFYYMLMPEPGEENGNEDPRERSRRR